jgi:hypothetical protein
MTAIERLLERLQTGWAPKTDELGPDILQRDLMDWDFGKEPGAWSVGRLNGVSSHPASTTRKQVRSCGSTSI